jgi:hypothetical protein
MLGPFAFQWHCFSHKYGYEVLSSFWTISTYLVCRGAWCQSQAKESQRDSEWGWFVKWCQLGAVCTLEIDLREKNTKGCECWWFFFKESADNEIMKPAKQARNEFNERVWWSWEKCEFYIFVSMSAKDLHILISPSWFWYVNHHLIVCLGSLGYNYSGIFMDFMFLFFLRRFDLFWRLHLGPPPA